MNAPTDHDLDNLFRSHLSGALDSQRGRAIKAFRAEVIRPAERSEARSSAYRIRNWSAIGLTMAACIAVGMVVPQFMNGASSNTGLPTISPVSSVATNSLPNVVGNTTVTGFERTTVLDHIDEGTILLNNGNPARKVRQQKYESFRFVDPGTNERLEYVIPTEREVIYPSSRQ